MLSDSDDSGSLGEDSSFLDEGEGFSTFDHDHDQGIDNDDEVFKIVSEEDDADRGFEQLQEDSDLLQEDEAEDEGPTTRESEVEQNPIRNDRDNIQGHDFVIVRTRNNRGNSAASSNTKSNKSSSKSKKQSEPSSPGFERVEHEFDDVVTIRKKRRKGASTKSHTMEGDCGVRWLITFFRSLLVSM